MSSPQATSRDSDHIAAKGLHPHSAPEVSHGQWWTAHCAPCHAQKDTDASSIPATSETNRRSVNLSI